MPAVDLDDWRQLGTGTNRIGLPRGECIIEMQLPIGRDKSPVTDDDENVGDPGIRCARRRLVRHRISRAGHSMNRAHQRNMTLFADPSQAGGERPVLWLRVCGREHVIIAVTRDQPFRKHQQAGTGIRGLPGISVDNVKVPFRLPANRELSYGDLQLLRAIHGYRYIRCAGMVPHESRPRPIRLGLTPRTPTSARACVAPRSACRTAPTVARRSGRPPVDRCRRWCRRTGCPSRQCRRWWRPRRRPACVP